MIIHCWLLKACLEELTEFQSFESLEVRHASLQLSAGEHGPHLARSVEKHVRWFWRYIMCPLLFGLIGTLLNFNGLDTGTVAKAIAIIFAGALPVIS